MVEKPFGRDLASARELNDVPAPGLPRGRAIFRIDHFLGKESVENLLVFRFANSLLEPVWNRNFISQRADHDGRGLRRRGPGQVLRERRRAARRRAEPPARRSSPCSPWSRRSAADADALRDEKVKLFRQIRTIDPAERRAGPVPRLRRRGRACDAGSDVETYVAVALRDRLVAVGRRAVADPRRQVPAGHRHRGGRRRSTRPPRLLFTAAEQPGARAQPPAVPARAATTASRSTCRPRRRATSWSPSRSTSTSTTTRRSATARRPTSGCSRTPWRATAAASAGPTPRGAVAHRRAGARRPARVRLYREGHMGPGRGRRAGRRRRRLARAPVARLDPAAPAVGRRSWLDRRLRAGT